VAGAAGLAGALVAHHSQRAVQHRALVVQQVV
jgi:hypothetical protein